VLENRLVEQNRSCHVRSMETSERIVTVTEPITGITETRRLFKWDEIAFSLQMAMMQNVWAGTQHKHRDGIRRMMIDAIREQFQVSGYQVLGAVPEAAVMNPNVYMGGNPERAR
jgi:hypothetical protein